MIEAKNISYIINTNKVFTDISLQIKKSNSLHVVGSNGSGKSTLLRCLIGLTPLTKGEIIRNYKKIEYLGHKNALKSYLTCEENFLLQDLKNHDAYYKWIKKLKLNDKMDFLIGNLSFGQQKKAALMRVFLNNAELIVLDEPCVGLDNKTQKILESFLKDELAKGKAIIYSSHISINLNSRVLEL